MSESVTGKTQALVETWIAAKGYAERKQAELDQTLGRLKEAEEQLGKWLCPADATPGERFNIWFGNGILEARKTRTGIKVRWRKEPEGKQLIEQGA